MIRTYMFELTFQGSYHIKYLAKRLQPAKCINKEESVLISEKYGSTTTDSRSENEELIIKVQQTMLTKYYDNASS